MAEWIRERGTVASRPDADLEGPSRRPVILAAVAAALTAAALCSAPTAVAAPPRTARAEATIANSVSQLPLASFGDMVVDGAGHQLLFTDPTEGRVIVTDYTGHVRATLTDLPGVDQLSLDSASSTVYAAVPGSDTVAAIDTATDTVTHEYPTGAGTGPLSAVRRADRIWFGYGSYGAGDIGSIDLSTTPPTVRLAQAPRPWSAPPLLFASPFDSDTIVAGETYDSPTPIAVYDGGSGTLRTQAQNNMLSPDTGHLDDVAFTPDGKSVMLATTAPYEARKYSLADLTFEGAYAPCSYNTAVAVSPGGQLAVGEDNPTGASIFMFKPNTTSSYGVYDFATAGSPTLLTGGLAWAPDDSRLFAVTLQPDQGAPIDLRVLTTPGKATTALLLGVPIPGASHLQSFEGQLRSDLPVAAGTKVAITRLSPGTSKAVALTTVTTDSTGSYSFTDHPAAEGWYTYTAHFAGDSLHLPSTGTTDFDIS